LVVSDVVIEDESNILIFEFVNVNMNRIFIVIIFLLLSTVSKSQWNLFTEAGINRSNIASAGRQPGGASREPTTSFISSLGIVKKFNHSLQFNNKISFLSKKYHESFFTSPDHYGTSDYQLSAFQLHVLIEKNISAKRKIQLYPSAGIYSTLHTAGTNSFDKFSFWSSMKSFRDIIFGQSDDCTKWDAGISFGGKVQWKKYFLHMLYDFGLIKPNPPGKWKWHSFYFTLGYFFKK